MHVTKQLLYFQIICSIKLTKSRDTIEVSAQEAGERRKGKSIEGMTKARKKVQGERDKGGPKLGGGRERSEIE